MPNKYVIYQAGATARDYIGDAWVLEKDGTSIALFKGDYPNNRTNAQKVCDLLNETSRSQGKHT